MKLRYFSCEAILNNNSTDWSIPLSENFHVWKKSLGCIITKKDLNGRIDIIARPKMQVQHCLMIYNREIFKVIDWEPQKLPAAAKDGLEDRGDEERPLDTGPGGSPKTEAYIRRLKNTHLALHLACMLSLVQLCDPMGRSQPGSSVHGIFLARILDWVAMPSSSSWPRDWTLVSCISCIAGRYP